MELGLRDAVIVGVIALVLLVVTIVDLYAFVLRF